MILFFFLLFSSTTLLLAQKNKPIPIIFDTDMGPDYDDVGAMAMLHYFANRGTIKILATVASCKHNNVAATLSVLNTYFKRPDIPIAVPKGWAVDMKDPQHWTDSLIKNYPHTIKSNEEAEDAVKTYRKILALQEDSSVTVITVGFLTNLYELLQTKGDEYSHLNGKELITKKVKKLVSMAGIFPSGIEFNVVKHKEAAKYVFEQWPTEIILSGFEIGKNIKTGLPLTQNNKIKQSPVKDAFRIAIPLDPNDSHGRMSWDQTAVLVAMAGYNTWYTAQRGIIIVNAEDGSNIWTDNPEGKHYKLVEKSPPSEVEKLINDMMMYEPKKKK